MDCTSTSSARPLPFRNKSSRTSYNYTHTHIHGLLVSKDLVSLIYQERERKQRKMAAPILTLIAASLLVGCTNSAMGWKETYGVINVAGKVMCQDCTKGYNDWINGDRPIKGTLLPLYIPLVASVMFLQVNPSNLTCIIARFLLYAHNYDIHLRSHSKISNFDELMLVALQGVKYALHALMIEAE